MPRESSPDFSNPAVQQSFVKNINDSKTLLQKELDVNRAEQLLLDKRIQLMQALINDLPSSDPQYVALLSQVQMDQIEMGELKEREMLLIQKLSE